MIKNYSVVMVLVEEVKGSNNLCQASTKTQGMYVV